MDDSLTKYIRRLARRYSNMLQNSSVQDLEQEGLLGAWEAQQNGYPIPAQVVAARRHIFSAVQSELKHRNMPYTEDAPQEGSFEKELQYDELVNDYLTEYPEHSKLFYHCFVLGKSARTFDGWHERKNQRIARKIREWMRKKL